MTKRTRRWVAGAAWALFVAPLSSIPAATVTLAWVPPAYHTDGSVVSTVTGYKVYCGTAPASYTRVIDTTANQVTVDDLPDGQRSYFTVTALTAAQVESAPAPELVFDPPPAATEPDRPVSGIGLGEALNISTLQFSTGGDRPWLGQTRGGRDDGSAVQSGTIGVLQQSWMQTTVTGPGTFSFWWRVSSEPDRDVLRFQVGTTEHAAISGAVTWQHRSVTLPAGTHTLRWTYATDGGVSVGANCGWIDNIVWQPNGGIWAGAWDFGNGWKYTEWFGYVYTAHHPWIYHERHGWLYAWGSTPESIVFWDSEARLYWWTSVHDYPDLYRYSDRSWLTYSTNTKAPRWFYNQNARFWERW